MDCRQETASPVLTKHDVVDRVSVHVLLVDVGGEQLNVAAAAVDALLVLHGELDDKRLVLVVEVIEAGRHGVEAGVLARLQTCARGGEREGIKIKKGTSSHQVRPLGKYYSSHV